MAQTCKAICVAAALVCLPGVAPAQEQIEVISLRYRTAEHVLPALRPLLAPGGALTGRGSQLFVRTSPANLANLRTALAAIDAPLRRLVVSVRYETANEAAGGEAGARLTPRAASVTMTDRRDARDERADQRLQVVEGGRAFIASGQSRPLREHAVVQTPRGAVIAETTVIQDVVTGFVVVPHVVGDTVVLDISPERSQPSGGHGLVQTHRAATTIRARFGEWVEVAGTEGVRSAEQHGIATTRRLRSASAQAIWVKVEESRP